MCRQYQLYLLLTQLTVQTLTTLEQTCSRMRATDNKRNPLWKSFSGNDAAKTSSEAKHRRQETLQAESHYNIEKLRGAADSIPGSTLPFTQYKHFIIYLFSLFSPTIFIPTSFQFLLKKPNAHTHRVQ